MTVANFFERLLWLPILFLCGCVIVIAAMLMDKAPPGEIVPGSQSATLDGDRLIVSYGFIRHRFCDAQVTRSLIDPRGRLEHMAPMAYTAEQVKDLQHVGPNRITLVMPRPAEVMPGRYVFQANVQYACNRAQEIWPIRVAISLPFKLVPGGQ